MAHLREDERFLPKNDDGVKLADFTATSAGGTQIFVHFGDQVVHRSALGQVWAQENMGVGGLDITIQEGYRGAISGDGLSERGGDGGFAGAAFATGNSDNHLD
jgi:hypothetical protein